MSSYTHEQTQISHNFQTTTGPLNTLFRLFMNRVHHRIYEVQNWISLFTAATQQWALSYIYEHLQNGSKFIYKC